MAEGVLVTISENAWTKVATNITAGFLRRPAWNNAGSFKFYWASRLTGAAAPSNTDKTDEGLSMPLFEVFRDQEISASAGIDIYVICENADGDTSDTTAIRVDV